jgi:hypothetical protein
LTIPEEEVRETVLTAIDVRTQMCMAAIVPSKGATPYTIAELKRFLFECGRTYAVLQCDGESSVKVVAQGIAKDLGGISLRYAPVGSSESQGSVERLHQTLFAQARVMRSAFIERYGMEKIDVGVDSTFMPWLVKHAAFTLNRFMLNDDGQTPFRRRWQRDFLTGMAEFGETVHFRITGRHWRHKADPAFNTGMWLGRDPD